MTTARISSEYKQTTRTRAPRLRSGQAKVCATPEKAMLRFFATHDKHGLAQKDSAEEPTRPPRVLREFHPALLLGTHASIRGEELCAGWRRHKDQRLDRRSALVCGCGSARRHQRLQYFLFCAARRPRVVLRAGG